MKFKTFLRYFLFFLLFYYFITFSLLILSFFLLYYHFITYFLTIPGMMHEFVELLLANYCRLLSVLVRLSNTSLIILAMVGSKCLSMRPTGYSSLISCIHSLMTFDPKDSTIIDTKFEVFIFHTLFKENCTENGI